MRTKSLIKLSSGVHVKTSTLSKEEFVNLTNKAKDYLTRWEKEIFILDDESVAYTMSNSNDEYYGWFSSLEDMEQLENDRPNRKSNRHFFEGYNPYKKDFPSESKKIIVDLLNVLGLKNEKLNRNIIRSIDVAILHQSDPQIFMINHIIHLIAVIGEVFLSENPDAAWYMDRDSDGETWLPMIKTADINGQLGTIDFVHWVYEDIIHYCNVGGLLESSYTSLNDFKRLGLVAPEKQFNSKIKVTLGGRIIKSQLPRV